MPENQFLISKSKDYHEHLRRIKFKDLRPGEVDPKVRTDLMSV
jgi:hypothetical protein